jgi:hypothetical protein
VGCLHAALVESTVAKAKVLSVDPSAALQLRGGGFAAAALFSTCV